MGDTETTQYRPRGQPVEQATANARADHWKYLFRPHRRNDSADESYDKIAMTFDPSIIIAGGKVLISLST